MPEDGVVVGNDVSKARLDLHLDPIDEAFSVSNDAKGHAALLKRLAKHKVVAIGLEASGGYEREVMRVLVEAGYTVRLLDPARVRSFARAHGQRAKTDRIDAALIARATVQLTGAAPELDPDRLRLRELLAQRTALIEQRKMATQQLERLQDAQLKRLTRTLVRTLERLTKTLEGAIQKLVADTPTLREPARRLATAPGVGLVLAATLLARLPELGKIRPKALAALAGVAPYARQSGTRDGPRHIAGGRPDLRSILYMATLSAVRANPRLEAFYQRLRKGGKPAKVALVAAMRKFLGYLDAMLRKEQDWRGEEAVASHS